MHRLFLHLLIGFAFLLTACSSSKKFYASTKEDKPLFKAINALGKRPGDEKARVKMVNLYNEAVARHRANITKHRAGISDSKWDLILKEFARLQHLSNSIQATPGAFTLVRPENYSTEIEQANYDAADSYYTQANRLLQFNTRPVLYYQPIPT